MAYRNTGLSRLGLNFITAAYGLDKSWRLMAAYGGGFGVYTF